MKRHSALIPFSHDHRKSLMVAQMMKRNAPAYVGMPVELTDKLQYVHMHFVMDMLPHFEKEESILFPYVSGRSADIDKMIEELKTEHIEIQHQFNALPAVADQITALDTAGHLLERHIRKEEREFFEMIQKVLTDEELIELQNKLN